MTRRAVLGASAAAAVSGLGLLTTGTDPAAGSTVDVPTLYQYGGAPAVQGGRTELIEEQEPNDDRHAANRLYSGQTVQATLDHSEVDWYTFSASAGAEMEVMLDRSQSNGATALLVYDSDGQNLDIVYVGNDAPATVVETAPSDGMQFAQVADIQSGSGTYALSVTVDGESDSATKTTTLTPTETTTPTTPIEGQSPFGGTARPIPGRIQAEAFDAGGEGTAYHDSTNEAKVESSYRDTAVDIEPSQDSTDDVSVGYTAAGEWLEYTVDVEPGTYEVNLRIAAARSNGSVRVSLGEQPLVEDGLPVTDGWFSWETITLGEVTVESATRDVLRLDILEAGMNLNWIDFTRIDTPTDTPTTTTSTPTETTGSDRNFGVQRYGRYGYGGIRQ